MACVGSGVAVSSTDVLTVRAESNRARRAVAQVVSADAVRFCRVTATEADRTDHLVVGGTHLAIRFRGPPTDPTSPERLQLGLSHVETALTVCHVTSSPVRETEELLLLLKYHNKQN